MDPTALVISVCGSAPFRLTFQSGVRNLFGVELERRPVENNENQRLMVGDCLDRNYISVRSA